MAEYVLHTFPTPKPLVPLLSGAESRLAVPYEDQKPLLDGVTSKDLGRCVEGSIADRSGLLCVCACLAGEGGHSRELRFGIFLDSVGVGSGWGNR